MTHHPPTLREQLPQIRRWSTLVLTTAALTLLGGWAFGAWSLPKMASYVSGTFEVDDGTREPAPPPEWRGERGTRVCLGCRTLREVHVEGDATRVLSESRPDVAEWILARLPAHVHAWHDTGCWTHVRDTADGVSWGISCLASVVRVDDELWWRYLRAHADDLRDLVRTETLGGPERAALLDEVAAWDAAHPDR